MKELRSQKLASGEIKPEVKKSDEEAVELMRSVLGLQQLR